jgi:hypothetical protein
VNVWVGIVRKEDFRGIMFTSERHFAEYLGLKIFRKICFAFYAWGEGGGGVQKKRVWKKRIHKKRDEEGTEEEGI